MWSGAVPHSAVSITTYVHPNDRTDIFRIIFRALQGLGGGATFAMCTVISVVVVPLEKYASLVAFISVVYAISLMVGPILGGVISEHEWRWLFLLNVPAAAPVVAIIFWCVPRGFPYHNKPKAFKQLLSKVTIKKVDFVGGALLLLATLSLTAAVEEAGLSHGWRSAFVVALLVVSGVLWILILFWERHITQKSNASGFIEPVFPWRFAESRIFMGMLL